MTKDRMRRTRRAGLAVIGAGAAAAALLPTSVGAQPTGPDDPPVDQWPATDIFFDDEGRPTAFPEEREQPERPASAGEGLQTLTEPNEIVLDDGVTQPVFSYEDAVREVVQVPSSVASEDGGELDMIYVDIIRPAASEGELDVPTIIIPSPYYLANGRGRAAETKQPQPGEPLDQFPLYYDNYFVPRGYAVALVDLAGTRGSTGCLDEGGAEVEGARQVVEWLAGNHVGYDLDGTEVVADWSNGLSGMTGKSYDGTVSIGVASTGVEGLATIVPIEGISAWYHWHFHNGLRFSGHTPFSLTNSLQGANSTMPGWQERCATIRAELQANTNNGDPDSDFWQTRNFLNDAADIDASVFVVHGTQDYNVKPINYGKLWEELAEHDVPRKMWLAPVGHEKAFDFRRDEWMDTIHRWYDHWLHGVDNGIMDEPVADVDHGVNDWMTYDTWPGGRDTPLRLGQPNDAGDPRPGALTVGRQNLRPNSQTLTWARRHYDTIAADGFEQDPQRLVFMTEELSEAVRVSGESTIALRASSTQPDAVFSAYLVDYGTDTRTDFTAQGGVRTLPTISCFGQGTLADSGCYNDVERNVRTRAHDVVARGWASATHVTGEQALVPGETYRVEWDIQTTDYTFEEGHRIGIVIAGADTEIHSIHNTPGNTIDVALNGSRVTLPVVGGMSAFRQATQ